MTFLRFLSLQSDYVGRITREPIAAREARCPWLLFRPQISCTEHHAPNQSRLFTGPPPPGQVCRGRSTLPWLLLHRDQSTEIQFNVARELPSEVARVGVFSLIKLPVEWYASPYRRQILLTLWQAPFISLSVKTHSTCLWLWNLSFARIVLDSLSLRSSDPGLKFLSHMSLEWCWSGYVLIDLTPVARMFVTFPWFLCFFFPFFSLQDCIFVPCSVCHLNFAAWVWTKFWNADLPFVPIVHFPRSTKKFAFLTPFSEIPNGSTLSLQRRPSLFLNVQLFSFNSLLFERAQPC